MLWYEKQLPAHGLDTHFFRHFFPLHIRIITNEYLFEVNSETLVDVNNAKCSVSVAARDA